MTLRLGDTAPDFEQESTEGRIHFHHVKPFGVAGLQLFFSDQHSRGVYPWEYLRELSQT